MKVLIAGLLLTAGCVATPEGQPAASHERSSVAESRGPSGLACEELGRYEVTRAFVVDGANGGRVWQRNVDPVRRTQPDALAYCKALDIDGRSGWRLPSVDELQGIRFKPGLVAGGNGSCVPSIDQNAFPDTPADWFWTSTRRPLGDAMFTGFDDGRSHGAELTEPMYVRCVHDADAL